MCLETFNLWSGIVGYCLVGPHVVPHRLTGNPYRYFLSHELPKLLEDVPLAVRARMWYMHDGAPAHFRHPMRGVLSNTYHGRWISRGGPTAWPPRSPDMNPPDFYLWGRLNTLVYAAPVDNEEALHHRIVDVCQTIHNYPGIFERLGRSMTRRVEACIESHEGILSTYYICTLSAVTQIRCFRTQVDMDIVSCFGMWNSCPKFVRTFQLHFVYR
jgi:hypothetical protein